MITLSQIDGWYSFSDQLTGFNYYLIQLSTGQVLTIRQNSKNGTAEVFLGIAPLMWPETRDSLFEKVGSPGSNGKEELDRALLFVDSALIEPS